MSKEDEEIGRKVAAAFIILALSVMFAVGVGLVAGSFGFALIAFPVAMYVARELFGVEK